MLIFRESVICIVGLENKIEVQKISVNKLTEQLEFLDNGDHYKNIMRRIVTAMETTSVIYYGMESFTSRTNQT